MENNSVQSNDSKQAQRPQPMTKTKSIQKNENHGPTKISGRADYTPDGTIEHTPEETAP